MIAVNYPECKGYTELEEYLNSLVTAEGGAGGTEGRAGKGPPPQLPVARAKPPVQTVVTVQAETPPTPVDVEARPEPEPQVKRGRRWSVA